MKEEGEFYPSNCNRGIKAQEVTNPQDQVET